jgi:hypothetical protein
MKQYLFLGAALALVMSLSGAFYLGGRHGYMSAEKVANSAILSAQDRERKAVDELQAERAKKKEAIRVEIREIEKAPDPSGCATITIPDSVYDQIR